MGVYIGAVKDDYSAMQGPAPDGFHVPSKDEWVALCGILTSTFGMTNNSTTIGTYLKMSISGRRQQSNANISGMGSIGYYWSSTSYNVNSAYNLYILSSRINPQYNNYRSNGFSVRCFKNSPTIPTSSWTTLYQGSGNAGVFWSSTDGLISVSGDGQTWYTIMDKNLGATTVYNQGDTLTDANCGYFYQWGNNYGFPHSGSVTTSSTQVNAQNYGPGNYYSSSTFITRSSSPYDWSSIRNDNLWGGVTGVKPTSLKNAYIGEYPERWKPGANTLCYYPFDTDYSDQSGNGYNLTNRGATTIGTKGGVDCAVFIKDSNSGLYTTSVPFNTISTSMTFNFWMYVDQFNTGENNVFGMGTASRGSCIILWYLQPINIGHRGYNDIATSTTSTLSTWQNIVVTQDSSGTKIYLDGNQIGSSSYYATLTGNEFNVGYFNGSSALNRKYMGGMSNLILESKTWTAQEVADYYNQTKSLYGIS